MNHIILKEGEVTMEIKIISRECIKPSSPTPHHLRTHKLSLFDQCLPSVYIPVVLFYPIDHKTNQDHLVTVIEETTSQLLKQSLSQTLTRYYPLAGKIKDNLSIDCNDEGMFYVEAQVKSHLSEFLNKLNHIYQIHQFLPSAPSLTEQSVGDHIAMVQVNTFDCGGIVIGLSILHMIMDGTSLGTFLKDWGATTTAKKGNYGENDSKASCPNFSIVPSLYPQNDSFPKELSFMGMMYPFFKMGKFVTRRFIFDASSLAKLKAKALATTPSSSQVQNPTRVEVVTALIWKSAMVAFKEKSGVEKPSILTHAVNMRRRAVPPFSDYLMGNLVCPAVAQSKVEVETKTKTELSHLVHELRQAITKVNGDLLKKFEGDEGFYKWCEFSKEMAGVISSAASSDKGADYIGFTSWCNFGFYEVDFGWGKPKWATSTGIFDTEEREMSLNFCFMMETRSGDGIEARVTLDEQEMALFECNQELLAFASVKVAL